MATVRLWQMDNLEAIIEQILARGDLRLTAAERAALEAAPEDHELAQRILGADAFNLGDPARSVMYSRRALAARVTVENQSNLISALARAGQLEEAAELTASPDCLMDPITQASRMSEINASMGRRSDARDWGRRALDLKDAAAPAVSQPRAILHSFDPERPERNIIAFSLFGADNRYLHGALRNAVVARHLYPGWTPRFHVDESVPSETLDALIREGAQVRRVQGLPSHRFGLFWRFLVEEDPAVALYLVRDADSVLNIRERMAVQDWLDSGQPFHVMRDWFSHSELVLAGMWGAHRGNLPGMQQRIVDFVQARANVLNSRAVDQVFLREAAWPLIRGRAKVHDSIFGQGDPFPPGSNLPGNMHVGQNETKRRPRRG